MSECQCGGANKRPPAVLSVFTMSEVTGVRRRVRSQESKSTFTLLKKNKELNFETGGGEDGVNTHYTYAQTEATETREKHI